MNVTTRRHGQLHCRLARTQSEGAHCGLTVEAKIGLYIVDGKNDEKNRGIKWPVPEIEKYLVKA